MSKPTGTIPADFPRDGDVLRIGGRPVDELVSEAGGTPLFVYDLSIVDLRIQRFRSAMPAGLHLHFAMKANPYAPLLKHVAQRVDGLDVASGGEMVAALRSGMKGDHISFAGPGKRGHEISAAIAAGVTLNCESEGEAERTIALADKLGLRPRMAVRVNPDFGIRRSGMQMGGGAKPFGVDAERVPGLVRRLISAGVEWRGLHIFVGSQALDPEALVDAQRETVALAGRLSEQAGAEPPLVNLGGGFGVPYFGGEQPLDIERVGEALGEAIATRSDTLANSRFAIELGRWLVAECGVYLTRIVDRKVSHGRIFLVTDGGMHHQLAASGNFGQLVRRNYPVAIATRWNAPATEEASIVGCLCTPLDRLADDVMIPAAQPGDLVAVFMAGAYGLTASPQAFLDQQPAIEMVVETRN